MHRLPTDEVYPFYLGDPCEQLLLHPDGRNEVVMLGPDLATGQRVQHVAPRMPGRAHAFVMAALRAFFGTTMAPGFDAAVYEPGDRARCALPTRRSRRFWC